MPNSRRWSGASVPCRIEWRTSRWLLILLGAMAPLAALAVLFSDLPRLMAWPLAAFAAGYSAWLVRREHLRPAHALVVSTDGMTVTVDGCDVEAFAVQWRGPLAFASWRDSAGGQRRLVWWPDTLPVASRRELRLAALAPRDPREAHSVAT